jgi:serine/threonine-protein kinase
MPESAPSPPDHAAATTIAPTELGELPPDLFADASFHIRYEGRDGIGEGGMGVVRACLDRRIGREVAMKVVRPGDGSRGDLKARFVREACVQGQLEHPAIVPVYDLGRDPEGTLYFTMKRVRGATFEQVVDALRAGNPGAVQQYSRRKLLSAFARVCHAIAFAHARGVVHRDLKPANVMLGDYGEVYVLDWGLAKLVGRAEQPPSPAEPEISSGPDLGAKTKAGSTMGTPGYMAPEQLRGEEIDARADVYALGAILFELLALQPLHGQGTPMEAKASTLSAPDARPSARAPEADIAPELDAICVHATASDPADRTSSVMSVVDAVERYLDGDRDLARRQTLAREHAAAGAAHAEEALAGGTGAVEARSLALREIGRAIALDPNNEQAVATLMQLMTRPPREVPAEARVEMLRRARRGVRRGMGLTVWTHLAWFAYAPFAIWMGIRGWALWVLGSVVWAMAGVNAYLTLRKPDLEARLPLRTVVLSAFAVSLTTIFFGPFVLLPTLCVMGAMLGQMQREPARRRGAALIYTLAFAVPTLLQSLGLLPGSYSFDNDSLVIHSGTLHLPQGPTYVFMVTLNIGIVLGGSLFMSRLRDSLSEFEERLSVQSWQLQQLVPEQARGAGPQLGPESLALRLATPRAAGEPNRAAQRAQRNPMP